MREANTALRMRICFLGGLRRWSTKYGAWV